MNFGFSEEQELLRAEVRKFLDQNCPLEEVRKLSETPQGFSRSYWDRFAELGWVGLGVPEVHGGIGLGWGDLVVVLEETGRTLFPSPLIATSLASAAIQAAGSEAQQARWLPGIADGSLIGTLAHLEDSDVLGCAGVELLARRDADAFLLTGGKHMVLDAANADLFVVPFKSGAGEEDISLAVIERATAGLDVEPAGSIDVTQRQGRLRLDGVRVETDAILGEPGGAAPLFERLLDCGAVAITAEAIGASEAALELTASYAKQRVQFDQPIGRFQGVKHPLAEMYVDIESFKSLLYYAAWALDNLPEEASLAASRAKAYASEAFPRIGSDTVGLHGGIGYTWEYDAHLYLKRAKWCRPTFGDADYHYERVARLGGI